MGSSIGSPKEIGESIVLGGSSALWLPFALGWDPSSMIGADLFVVVGTIMAFVGGYSILGELGVFDQ